MKPEEKEERELKIQKILSKTMRKQKQEVFRGGESIDVYQFSARDLVELVNKLTNI